MNVTRPYPRPAEMRRRLDDLYRSFDDGGSATELLRQGEVVFVEMAL